MSIAVKICGITRPQDGACALELGAAELGFILAPSPRRVEPETVRLILEELRGGSAGRRRNSFRAIGVFVNEDPGAMRDIISYTGLDAAQVHGDERPENCTEFGFPWYRALRPVGAAEAASEASLPWGCDRLLVDAATRSAYGGTGISVGIWAALAARRSARALGREFFLAGGIGPASVGAVVHSIRPDGIDVSSGVEEAPGRKSREKLEELFAALRRAEADALRDAEARSRGEEYQFATR